MVRKNIVLGVLIYVSFLFSQEKNTIFTGILQKYVQDGKVNYAVLQDDPRLDKYLIYLADTDPAKFNSQEDKLAFYINAYNAYTLKVICKNYPVESINDLHFGGLLLGTVFKSTIWDQDSVVINHSNISLNYLKQEIIRQVFSEPRIHFALVNAAKSSPALRSEAYEGSKLDEQLNDQAKKFFSNTDKNKFDLTTKTAYLSEILQWYDDDFGDSDESVLKYVAQYAPDKVKEDILNDPESWEISYLEYDWSLND